MVSFITINYNAAALTLQCVASITQQLQGTDYEIIIVDNDSQPQDCQHLSDALPEDCHLIRCRQNIGFGGANMLGANFAKGDFLCFINNDVVLTEDCVTPLVDYLKQHDHVGCITPQQYDAEGHFVRSFNHENSILTKVVPKGLLERWFPRRYPSRAKLHEKPIVVHNINGAFMLFPTSVFWKCGGFDLNLFLYSEEYDIAMRLKQIGKVCVVEPTYRFTHLQGQSAGRTKSLSRRESYISGIYCYQKYHSNWLFPIYKLVILLRLIPHVHDWYVIPAIICGNSLSRSMRHRL